MAAAAPSAGASAISALGVVSGVLGIVSFFKDLVPEKPAARGAAVRIKAGLDTAKQTNLGGEISGVWAFDRFNGYLGRSDGVKLKDGDSQTVTVSQKSGGTGADFISVANANDATCIAWIVVNQEDQSNSGAWTGDIGAECGHTWGYSEQIAGKIKFTDKDGKEKEEDYIPKCTWLDGDHTGTNFPNAAMKFRVRAYGEDVVSTAKNKDDMCKFTTFDKDNGPIKRAPGGADKPQGSKREVAGPEGLNSTTPTDQNPVAPASNSTGLRLPSFEGKLIISSYVHHTGKELCESSTSAGPDFVGSDGMFCDMTVKKLSPLCSKQKVDECVEVDNEKKTVTKRSHIGRRQENVIHKTYNVVDNWQLSGASA